MSRLLRILIKRSGENLFLPYYHVVGDENLPHIKHLYPVKKPTLFEKEIDFLLKQFKPISLEELHALQENREILKEPRFFLSFDDGFRQCYDVIAPLLLKKGVPATFFINSAFVDNKELMYRNKLSYLRTKGVIKKADFDSYDHDSIDDLFWVFAKHRSIDDFDTFLKKEKPYMTLSQIKELEKQGFTIGAHSHSHPYYHTISVKEQLSQTRQSLAFVNTHFNQKLRAFAFPFDDVGVTNEFFSQIEQEVDLFFTTGGIKQDERPDVYRRVDMEHQQDLPSFLVAQYGKFMLKKALNYRTTHVR